MTKKTEVHGHRGSRGTHPENTLVSFEEAFLSGADAFELDTQLTADEKVVVFHDFEVSARVCRKEGKPPTTIIPLRTLSLNELLTWDCGTAPQPKFPSQKLSAQKIPTFEETMSWLKQKPGEFYVNIEMKVEPEWPDDLVNRYTDTVLETIQSKGMVKRSLLQSFDFRPLRRAKKSLSDLRLSCLFDRDEANFVAEAQEVGAQSIGPFYKLLTEEVITRAHKANLKVIPWTVNEPKDWDRLIAWGIDGIITDYPRNLIHLLERPTRS